MNQSPTRVRPHPNPSAVSKSELKPSLALGLNRMQHNRNSSASLVSPVRERATLNSPTRAAPTTIAFHNNNTTTANNNPPISSTTTTLTNNPSPRRTPQSQTRASPIRSSQGANSAPRNSGSFSPIRQATPTMHQRQPSPVRKTSLRSSMGNVRQPQQQLGQAGETHSPDSTGSSPLHHGPGRTAMFLPSTKQSKLPLRMSQDSPAQRTASKLRLSEKVSPSISSKNITKTPETAKASAAQEAPSSATSRLFKFLPRIGSGKYIGSDSQSKVSKVTPTSSKFGSANPTPQQNSSSESLIKGRSSPAKQDAVSTASQPPQQSQQQHSPQLQPQPHPQQHQPSVQSLPPSAAAPSQETQQAAQIQAPQTQAQPQEKAILPPLKFEIRPPAAPGPMSPTSLASASPRVVELRQALLLKQMNMLKAMEGLNKDFAQMHNTVDQMTTRTEPPPIHERIEHSSTTAKVIQSMLQDDAPSSSTTTASSSSASSSSASSALSGFANLIRKGEEKIGAFSDRSNFLVPSTQSLGTRKKAASDFMPSTNDSAAPTPGHSARVPLIPKLSLVVAKTIIREETKEAAMEVDYITDAKMISDRILTLSQQDRADQNGSGETNAVLFKVNATAPVCASKW